MVDRIGGDGMQWYEILILSTLELLSMFLIWNKLNKKVEVWNKKSFFIVLLLLFTTFIFFIYQIDIGFVINYILLCSMMIVVFRLPIKEVALQFVIVLTISASLQLLCIYALSLLKSSGDILFKQGLIINITIGLLSLLINKFVVFDRIGLLSRKRTIKT